MQATIVSGVAMWSRWQADRAMFFNARFVEGDGGNMVVDRLEPDAEALASLRAFEVLSMMLDARREPEPDFFGGAL